MSAYLILELLSEARQRIPGAQEIITKVPWLLPINTLKEELSWLANAYRKGLAEKEAEYQKAREKEQAYQQYLAQNIERIKAKREE